MNGWIVRQKRHLFKRIILLLVAVCLVFGPGVIPVPAAQAAVGDTLTYSFPALTSNPDNPNWTVTDIKPENMRLTPTSFQMINAAAAPAVNGEYLNIRLYVPESGIYDLAMQTWENIAGGYVGIEIDGQQLQSRFSFYATTQTSKSVKPITAGLRLDKGYHNLTFKAAETVKLSGKYYIYLYLEDFRLKAKEIFNELNEVTLTAAQTYLNVGAEAPLTVDGKMAGGAAVDLAASQIVYTSSNPDIVTVTPTGIGTARVTAQKPGRAKVKASVTLNGVTRESEVDFNIGVQPESVVFDFKKPVNSKLSEAGWEIGDRSIGIVSSQPYGMLASANKVGDYISYRFLVPKEGYYEVRFNGAASAGGAQARAAIDGMEAGIYSFYLGSAANSKGAASMRTVFLSAGVHELRLTVTGRYQLSNGWAVMPSSLQLDRKAGLPTLKSFELAVSKNDLMVGQTSKVTPRGQLADGFVYNLAQASPSSVTMSVYDPALISLTPDGSLHALQPGAATVTAQVYLDGIGMSASQPILVNSKTLSGVTVTSDKPKLSLGMSAKLTVTGQTYGEPVDLSDAAITFASLTPSVATVDAGGAVTPLATGTAQLQATVTLGPAVQTGTVNVQVMPPYLTELSVSMFRPKTFVGEKRKLDLSGKLNNGQRADLSQAAITYASSNPQAVAVDASGVLNIMAAGTSKVTATVTLGDVTKSGTVTVDAQELTSSKLRATYFTDAKVANARRNAQNYDWAKSIKDAAVSRADKYLAKGADYVWSMVPSNSLPRSYAVNQTLGSPITGKEIDKFGNYPYLGDSLNEPWKIVDPSSGYKFPTNDFGAYYRSGLDAHGFFDPNRADRSLLVNTLYPEKGPTWGVDDGFGWVDEYGNRYTFIAYYMHWFQWYGSDTSLLQSALNAVRDAYLYTGDPKYADYGIILLDRIADVYPDLDISKHNSNLYLNSHGGTNTGKAIGKIWETGLAKDFVMAYDAFFPAFNDPVVAADVLAFFNQKTQLYDLPLKTSVTGIKRNIEDGIIRQIYPGVKTAQIHGNNGFHQSTLAMAAVVLDTLPETKEWLDFNYQAGGLISGPWHVTGGNISAIFVNDVDRDGEGFEASPEYLRYWLGTFESLADAMDGYDKYPQGDLFQNVKFRKMYQSIYPLLMSEMYIPNIGDSASTGNPGLFMLNKTQFIKAFDKFRDPIYAQLAHFMNNGRLTGIHGDIFSADPDQIARDIEQTIQTNGPLKLESDNLTGYGFAALRDGEKAKFDYGIPYAFTELPITATTKQFKIFDGVSSLQFEADNIGDSITFEIDVPQADTYELSLRPYRTTTYGKYRISVDGQPLTEYDFYGSVWEHGPIGSLTLNAGKHLITFECIGKNDSSTGYKMGLSQLALLNASERERRDATFKNMLRDMWMYYGRNTGHGHRDALNLGMHAYGLDLLPDLGYPEVADGVSGQRHEWTAHTISHNTVMVNKTKQQDMWVGTPKLFDDGDLVKLMDVEAPDAYKDSTSLYKRTTAMIRVNDESSYTVDFFRVKGGSDHHFSFHAAEGPVTTEGLTLTPQTTGTYAGPDVEYGQRPAGDSAPGWGYAGPGFHWLKNVERDNNPGDKFSIDWKVKDTWHVLPNEEDIHLRLTMLGGVTDVALSDGIPAQNKPGNPASLRYLVAHRQGTNLDSLFTSVIEPYKDQRFIRSIERVAVTLDGQPVEQDVRAVKVTLTSGRTDYIVSSLRSDSNYVVDGKFTFRGQFGVYAEKNGEQVYGYVNNGTEIGSTALNQASLNGSVADFTRELSLNNTITVDFGQPLADAQSLIGRYMYVGNDGVRNASYRIRGIAGQDGGKVTFGIGDVTTIRSWKNVNNYSLGFVYDIAAGQTVTIPLSAEAMQPQIRLTGNSQMWNGSTQTLHAELVYPDDGRKPLPEGAVYSSSRPDVASVDAAGVVTALKPGVAVIAVKSSGKESTLEITVKEVVLQSIVVEGNADMTAGERQTLRVTGIYSDGSRSAIVNGVELKSSNHSVVKVEKTFELRAIREGQAVITAAFGGFAKDFPIAVHKKKQNESDNNNNDNDGDNGNSNGNNNNKGNNSGKGNGNK